LRDPKLAEEDAESVRETLRAFIADRETQKLIAGLLADPKVGQDQVLLLLDVIDRSSLKELPPDWIERIRSLLDSTNSDIRLRAVELARSRALPGLDAPLAAIANDPRASDTLRASALAAVVAKNPRLRADQYAFLTSRLVSGSDAILRQSVARTIARANPSKEQLLELARKHLRNADPLVLSTVLEVFRSKNDEQVGEAMLSVLRQSPAALATLGEERLKALLAGYPERVQQLAKPLFGQLQQAQKARVDKLRGLEHLLTASGDVGRGRRIFFGEKVACASCHTIGMEGNNVGPDLTGIGAIRSGHDLLEAIVFPSASFVPGHEIFNVDTRNDRLSGVIRSRGRDVVVLITGPNGEVRIPRSEVRSITPSKVSLMPEGFDESLTKPELADLLAFLQAEKTRPTQARRLP
jgi:putative heme-binding domain-containing protein